MGEAVSVLIGRQAELEHVDGWVRAASRGAAGLLIRGEPGIGKTAVWEAAIAAAHAAGARVLVAKPAVAELPLGYVGLGDLLGGVAAEVLPELPVPQSTALAVALLLANTDEVADPAHVARATASSLRTLGSSGPVVIAVDDVQWLDPASAAALAFAIRRTGGEAISVAVTLRDGHPEPLGIRDAFGPELSEIALEPLSVGSIGVLLRSRADPGVSRRRVVGIHERSGGNPFYALQLATVGADTLPETLQGLVRRRLDEAPAAGDAIDLIAVHGPVAIGAVDAGSVDAAVSAGLLREEAGTIRFVHPLFAAGAYDRIPPGRRRALHREAARAARTLEDRARHLALAAVGPDAETAGVVERAAAAARARGAPQAAVELAEHAVRLTPSDDAEARSRRLMDQADYLALSANEPAAAALVDELLAGAIHGPTRVRALVQRAVFETTASAAVATLEAAVAEPQDDPLLAARTLAQLAWQRGAWLGDVGPAYDEAVAAIKLADEVGDPATRAEARTAAGLLASIGGRPGAADHFREAIAVDSTLRYPSAHSPRMAFASERRWRGDYAAAEALFAEEHRVTLDAGDDSQMLRLNLFMGELAVNQGQWDEAERLFDAALVDGHGYWRGYTPLHRAILRARRGDPAALDDIALVHESPNASPDLVAAAEFARGLLEAGTGDIAAAADHVAGLSPTADASGGSHGVEFAQFGPEAIGVLAEAGRVDEAREILGRLERRRVQLEPWLDAALDLGNGYLLLAETEPAKAAERFGAAADRFTAMGGRWDAARSRLGEGMALRLAGRRRDAATALEAAAAVFEELRAAPSLRRARDELRRARPRLRHDDSLTDAETRVATLVAEGRRNREVAAALFTTVATVEAHLTRIYAKLGVRSRSELTRRVADGALGAPASETSELSPRAAPGA